jgi:hypothetical protein
MRIGLAILLLVFIVQPQLLGSDWWIYGEVCDDGGEDECSDSTPVSPYNSGYIGVNAYASCQSTDHSPSSDSINAPGWIEANGCSFWTHLSYGVGFGSADVATCVEAYNSDLEILIYSGWSSDDCGDGQPYSVGGWQEPSCIDHWER